MKLLIVEDEPLIARDLLEILEEFSTEIKIVHTYNQAVSSFSQHHFDFCFCDVNLNGEKSGIDVAIEVKERYPNIQLIYITSYIDSDTIKNIGKTQPINLISKPYTPDQVKASFRLAISNLNQIKKDISNQEKLTQKELEILHLIAENKTSNEIAKILFLSEKTVRNHRYNIKKKLGLSHDKNSLLLYAISYFK